MEKDAEGELLTETARLNIVFIGNKLDLPLKFFDVSFDSTDFVGIHAIEAVLFAQFDVFGFQFAG
jgi:hypothetical protein